MLVQLHTLQKLLISFGPHLAMASIPSGASTLVLTGPTSYISHESLKIPRILSSTSLNYPNDLTAESLLDTILKWIFYFDSEDACHKAVQFIRKCLPDHLHRCVHTFSSNMSELEKLWCWEFFSNGGYHIICATDAAGMGCNVSDVPR